MSGSGDARPTTLWTVGGIKAIGLDHPAGIPGRDSPSLYGNEYQRKIGESQTDRVKHRGQLRADLRPGNEKAPVVPRPYPVTRQRPRKTP